MTLYDELVKIGAEIDNHESDLYVRAMAPVKQILVCRGYTIKSFISEVDGKLWYEIPFGYDPWWRGKA